MILRAPFVYFGGKAPIAAEVWKRLGRPKAYVEPFFGSGAVLLRSPAPASLEVANDLNCFIANFWRAIQADPDTVAKLMDWPVNETDIEARQKWLVEAVRKQQHQESMRDDPEYYDPKIAAWWCWGLGGWIGHGWCSGEWHGRDHPLTKGHGVKVKSMARGGALPKHTSCEGVHRKSVDLVSWMRNLQARLRPVKVCCGDWTRVLNLAVYRPHNPIAVFLDPPYGVADRSLCYTMDSRSVAGDVLAWCLEHGPNPHLRIALCGYDVEHTALEDKGWSVLSWTAHGGMSKGDQVNKYRERVWFSPHCIRSSLFDMFSQ